MSNIGQTSSTGAEQEPLGDARGLRPLAAPSNASFDGNRPMLHACAEKLTCSLCCRCLLSLSASRAGIMDPAFFVGKVVLLKWLNDFVRTHNDKPQRAGGNWRATASERAATDGGGRACVCVGWRGQFDAGYAKVEQTCTGAMRKDTQHRLCISRCHHMRARLTAWMDCVCVVLSSDCQILDAIYP